MNSINYHEYTEFRCDKCGDRYYARYGAYSDRTSCRYHFWEKEADGSTFCRDCKKSPSEINSHNCYHVSRGNDCCWACIIS